MRTLIVITVATAILAAGSIWAQETDPVQQATAAWQAEQAQRSESEQRLNQLMTVMTQEMEAMHQADDRAEQQKLMAAHREHMNEAMGLMRDLGGAHMRELTREHLGSHQAMHHSSGMAGTAGGHMMSTRPREHMSDATRLGDLETRVDMMQIMLESMLNEDAGS